MWHSATVLSGTVGYRSAGRTIVVYSFFLFFTDSFLNLFSLVSLNLAAPIFWLMCERYPCDEKESPRTFPLAEYSNSSPSTSIGALFLLAIGTMVYLDVFVVIFHLSSKSLICFIALCVTFARYL